MPTIEQQQFKIDVQRDKKTANYKHQKRLDSGVSLTPWERDVFWVPSHNAIPIMLVF